PFDAAPLPIVCGSPPCATALVTTLGVETVDRGEEGFCALLHDGTVACWGAGGAGQLGRGNTQDSVTPARVVARCRRCFRRGVHRLGAGSPAVAARAACSHRPYGHVGGEEDRRR
ncbi:MAG: hypothetical protein J0I07_40605, partial [Myxococcales bacterium]|nr:hypothetical protein [Myxococcales bacterium]